MFNFIKIIREWFDPAYKESDFDRIKRIKNARLKFDRNNINPYPHTTHSACQEIINLYGGKAHGCCCTGHICKK